MARGSERRNGAGRRQGYICRTVSLHRHAAAPIRRLTPLTPQSTSVSFPSSTPMAPIGVRSTPAIPTPSPSRRRGSLPTARISSTSRPAGDPGEDRLQAEQAECLGVVRKSKISVMTRRLRRLEPLDPEGEGRRKINQTTNHTVGTVRNPQRRIKDRNPTLTETIWKCDSSALLNRGRASGWWC